MRHGTAPPGETPESHLLIRLLATLGPALSLSLSCVRLSHMRLSRRRPAVPRNGYTARSTKSKLSFECGTSVPRRPGPTSERLAHVDAKALCVLDVSRVLTRFRNVSHAEPTKCTHAVSHPGSSDATMGPWHAWEERHRPGERKGKGKKARGRGK